VKFAHIYLSKVLAASADKLDAARLLHPPSGGSGVVHTAPFFLPLKIRGKGKGKRRKTDLFSGTRCPADCTGGDWPNFFFLFSCLFPLLLGNMPGSFEACLQGIPS